MDDLVVFHRHPDGIVEMPVARTERVDHVVVAHHRCSCGTQRAILSRVMTADAGEPGLWSVPAGRKLSGDAPS